MNLIDTIDALLPQTQCTRCGYPTCHAYAEAIARDEADIDRCPPGGTEGIAALAGLLGRTTKPLDPARGIEAPPTVALIDEDVCIGCTKCIKACPVDAIVGAGKRMHTVIADECTGCGLCLPPCPVDCIALVPTADRPLARSDVLARASHARRRFDARNARSAALRSDKPRAGIAAEAAPTGTHGIAAEAAPTGTHGIGAEAPPTTAFVRVGGASAPMLLVEGSSRQETADPAPPPISRSAVLEAIARGRARKRGGTP